MRNNPCLTPRICEGHRSVQRDFPRWPFWIAFISVTIGQIAFGARFGIGLPSRRYSIGFGFFLFGCVFGGEILKWFLLPSNKFELRVFLVGCMWSAIISIRLWGSNVMGFEF